MLEKFTQFEIQNPQGILGGNHGNADGIPPDNALR